MTEQQKEQIVELARRCEQFRRVAKACYSGGNGWLGDANTGDAQDASAEAFRIAQGK